MIDPRESLSPLKAQLLAAASTAVIAALQHAMGIEVSFSIFYVFPVALVAAAAGLGRACAWAVLCAAVWAVVDIHSGHAFSHPFIPLWNAAVRAVYFSIAAYAVSAHWESMRLERSVSGLKSEMISVVSHEFGNSLATMTMAIHYLREEKDLSAPAREKMFEILSRGVSDMSRASANFLNRARIESGRLEIDPRPVALAAAVGAAAASLKLAAESADVRLELDVPEDLSVVVDPAAFDLVLRNLIGNGVKYTPRGGSVRVALLSRSDSRCVVGVRDTGIGMKQEDIARVASGFYRTGAGRAKAQGYGVGLKVTRDLLEAHGSGLRIESRPGAGSEFSFDLPVFRREYPTQEGRRA